MIYLSKFHVLKNFNAIDFSLVVKIGINNYSFQQLDSNINAHFNIPIMSFFSMIRFGIRNILVKSRTLIAN